MPATLVAAKHKIVSSGKFNLSLYPATDGFPLAFAHGEGKDLPTGVAGDQVAVLLATRPGPAEVTMPAGQEWQCYRTPVKPSDPPILGKSPDVIFSEPGDMMVRKSPAHTLFAFSRPYVAGETWKFAARGLTYDNGAETHALVMLIRGGATNPFATLPYAFNNHPGSVYTFASLTGLLPLSPVVQFLYATLSVSASDSVVFQSGREWSDVPGQMIVDAFGVRNTNVFGAGYAALTDGAGSVSAEDASLEPNGFTSAGSFTFLLAPKAPENYLGSPPSISGTVQGGKTVTFQPGTWSGEAPITYAYQLQSKTGVAAPVDVAGATGTSFAIGEGLVGKQLRVKVTATNGVGDTAVSFSALTAAVVTGLDPAPTGIPTFSGNALDGLAQPGETLNADVSGVSWTVGGGAAAVLVTEWGRSVDESMVSATVVGQGASRVVVPADVDHYLAVRQRNVTAGGVATGWSEAVNVTRPFVPAADRDYRLATLNSDGDLVPGSDLLGATALTPLTAAVAASGDYVDHSIAFLVNSHPAIAAQLLVWIEQPPTNPDVTIEFAQLDIDPNTPVPAFDPLDGPPTIGGWSQPTAEDPLDMGTADPRNGFVAMARRRTVAQAAMRRSEDKLVWTADAVVQVIE